MSGRYRVRCGARIGPAGGVASRGALAQLEWLQAKPKGELAPCGKVMDVAIWEDMASEGKLGCLKQCIGRGRRVVKGFEKKRQGRDQRTGGSFGWTGASIVR